MIRWAAQMIALGLFIAVCFAATAYVNKRDVVTVEAKPAAQPSAACLPPPPPKAVTDKKKRGRWEFDQRTIA